MRIGLPPVNPGICPRWEAFDVAHNPVRGETRRPQPGSGCEPHEVAECVEGPAPDPAGVPGAQGGGAGTVATVEWLHPARPCWRVFLVFE